MHWLSQYFPRNIASNGAKIDGIFAEIYWITAAVFLLVMGLMALFLFRYRHRPGRKAVYSHGNNTLELVWTVVPALILVVLTFQSEAVWSEVRGTLPPADLRVGVTGKQFNWLVYYPGADNDLGQPDPKTGKFASGDNVELTNELHVPAGRVVRVAIGSEDVIHSFFLPNLRLKQDAVPGRTVEVWFNAMEPGKYEIACAELCGAGHATMRGFLTVHDAAGWASWLETMKNDRKIPVPERPR